MRTQMSEQTFSKIRDAYFAMAQQALYRPGAPSDGFGTILTEEDVSEKEIIKYAKEWWAEEDNYSYFIGCCNFLTRPATIYAVEAARQMCSGHSGDSTALRLLKMAVKDLEAVIQQREKEIQRLHASR